MYYSATKGVSFYPFAKVGYYGYPGMPYLCHGSIKCEQYSLYNNRMEELWSQVDVLLPSIYMPYNSTGNLEIEINSLFSLLMFFHISL